MKENDILDEVVRRVVRRANPERIILFGSAARGDAGPDSDLDILVIKAGAHRRHLAMDLYEEMIGLRVSVDIIVATPEDVRDYGNNPALVFEPALREGKVIYAA